MARHTLAGISRAMRYLARSRHVGFSLAETTVILAAVSVLAATAAPSVLDYVAQARDIKASGDVNVLTHALAKLMFDVTQLKPAEPSGPAPIMLVGPGDVAEAHAAGDAEWLAPADGRRVQALTDHLVTNRVGYQIRGDAPFARGWNGPYVDVIPTDPWGRRYSSNVGLLGSDAAVVVVSAGPNGQVDTPFRGQGIRLGSDDIVGLLGGRQ